MSGCAQRVGVRMLEQEQAVRDLTTSALIG
jgi:hypothetical protein